ncbi:MAG: hypothetical protein HY841_06705 [Bacteroidetes bacterium]|nr:hypothetical protein [Bacteroidota bacterium]
MDDGNKNKAIRNLFKIHMFISLSMFLWVPMFVQTDDSTKKQKTHNNVEKKDSISFSKCARARIVIKDETTDQIQTKQETATKKFIIQK